MKINQVNIYKTILEDEKSHFNVLALKDGRNIIAEEYELRDAKKAFRRFELLKTSLKPDVELKVELYIARMRD